MTRCPACQADLPPDSRFCGLCGFRLTPISVVELKTLSQELEAIVEPEVVPLTKRKTPTPMPPAPVKPAPAPPPPAKPASAAPAGSAGRPPGRPAAKPRLEVVEQAALEDTVPKAPAQQAALEDTAPRPEVSQPSLGKAGRRARRYPLKVEVNFTSEHNFYTGFITNLSSGGLFLATHQPMAIGELLEIGFTVPGLNRLCTGTVEVRWIREYDPLNPDMIPGMGLKFVQLDAEARAAVELFIRHREPIFFDDD
jgi:uncharacterized protein (TIGR02266 family)